MSEYYRNRNPHQTRATRDMADKRGKLVKESKFAFLSAVIDHYCYLMDKKFRRQHDKMLEMSIMKACSDHYEDFNDNNLANFVKTYIAGKNMNI